MEIIIEKNLVQNVFHVTITTTNFTEAENEAIHDFGEPYINCGGDIEDSGGSVVATLDDNHRRIKAQFPITRSFKTADHGVDTEDIARAFIHTVVERLTAAHTGLFSNTDDFSGVENVIL